MVRSRRRNPGYDPIVSCTDAQPGPTVVYCEMKNQSEAKLNAQAHHSRRLSRHSRFRLWRSLAGARSRDRRRDMGLQGPRHRTGQLRREREDRRFARLPEQQRHVAPRRRHLVQGDRRQDSRLCRHDHRRQRRLHQLPAMSVPTTSLPRLSTAARPAATATRSWCSRTKAPPSASATTTCLWGAGCSPAATSSSTNNPFSSTPTAPGLTRPGR